MILDVRFERPRVDGAVGRGLLMVCGRCGVLAARWCRCGRVLASTGSCGRAERTSSRDHGERRGGDEARRPSPSPGIDAALEVLVNDESQTPADE
jgi:hypothetical protein